jgi:gliding motility-associated-like protein
MKSLVPKFSANISSFFSNYTKILIKNIYYPFLFICIFYVNTLKSQLIQTFDFNPPSNVYNATIFGYDKPGVGSYHRATNGGQPTFVTPNPACYGYTTAATTSSSIFIFRSTGTVNSVIIKATSGSNNRVLNAVATSTTLNGTYNNITFSTTGTINNGDCGIITFTPTTPIPPNTFIRFTLSGNLNVVALDVNVVPTGTPPTVNTNSVTAGINVATVNSTVNAGLPTPSMPIENYGIIWHTANTGIDVSLTTKTTITPATPNTFPGAYNSVATGLTPNGTQYYARAYVRALNGVVHYGSILPFTTLPPTPPTVTTNTVSNILSNRATCGGNVTDSGGLNILQKGICWSTTPNPTARLATRTNNGPNAGNFTALMLGLTPATTYYVRAFAINGVDTAYGVQRTFVTGAAVPALTATPLTLNFGNVNFNSTQPVQSYLLNGNFLAANGTVTVTAPNGYDVSTQSSTGFGTTATVTYTGTSFTNRRIYVRLRTNVYGTFNGNIVHSGGGTVPINTDTVAVNAAIIQDPTELTNTGTDFWLGNGYQERNDRVSGNSAEGKLSIYIAAGDQPAVINVEMPGIPGAAGFPKIGIPVPANTVVEIKDFPTGSSSNNLNPQGLPDTRLFYTGVSKRGIHVYSTNGAPVSVWMHTYASNNSAAAAMVFPTNTWNSSYTVQAYGGQPSNTPYVGGFTNNSNPNSFFFVIAAEDNTPIWFTPSQDVLDSVPAAIFSEGHTPAMVKYQKGVTYGPIMLNRGEIFNAMGFILNSGNNANGLDLTGSKVWTDCGKRIAVFGGNGRCLVNAATCNASSGSDHMIQQMFPKVAWGTKYVTVPTKTMEYNLFRITVDDPSTQVWVNNPNRTTPLTGLINNLYYEFATREACLIESNKPINVTQFITAGGCAAQFGAKGNGDPEMIILSPVQQAINRATVYSAPIKNSSATYNGHYINVVIRKEGVASFRLNNAALADTGINQQTANNNTCYNTGGIIPMVNAFQKHPYDTNYYFAKLKVSPNQSHTIRSDFPFNAIAYGMGDGESYGYNAGTAIKNLANITVAVNPNGTDTSTTSVKTCVGNPVKVKIALPYNQFAVDSIIWEPNPGTPVSPTGAVRGPLTANPNNPGTFYATIDGTITIDGQQYNLYTSPQTFIFNQEGTFQIKAVAKGTFVSDCGSESQHFINVTVGHDDISFTAVQGSCGSRAVTIADNSTPLQGTSITQWQWNFGDGTTFTSTNINNPNPVPNPHIYPPLNSGGLENYWIKLKTINSVGCFSEDSVFVDLSFDLKANFTVSKDTICAGQSVTFSDLSTSNAIEWIWNWGDASPNTVITGTAPAAPVTHQFNTAGTFNVKLTVKNSAGCTSVVKDTNIVVKANPVANFITPPGICLGGSMQFTNTSTPTTGVTYLWNFGDPGGSSITNPNTSNLQNPSHIYNGTGPYTVTLTVTLNNYGCTNTTQQTLSSNIYQLPTAVITAPTDACLRDTINFSSTNSVGGSGNTVTQWNWNFGDGNTSTLQNPKHFYTTTGTKTITLTVISDKGCISSAVSHTLTIKPTPNVTYIAIPSVCANATAFTITQFSQTTALPGNWSYTGTGVTGNTFNPAVAGVGTHQIIGIYTANNGCKDADTATVTVNALPTVNFTNSTITCEKLPVTFTNNSTANGGTITNAVWNWGYATPNTTGNTVNHTFQTPNTYNVSLTVTNSNNCTATGSRPVTIRHRPFANFNLPAAVCLPNGTATFQNLSSVADDNNPTYLWNFGDAANTTSILTNPTHNYTTTGPFNIKLTVTSQYGCVKDTTRTLTNVFTQPIADFTASPTSVCLNDSVQFTQASVGSVTSRLWDFGDGTTSTLANPKKRYNALGTYEVKYYHISAQGCTSNVRTRTITVLGYPVVDAGPTLWVLQGSGIALQPTVNGNNLSYKWTPATFLNSDTVLRPISRPTTDILYTLTVTGAGGCKASDTARVRILRKTVIPNAFSPNGDGVNDTWEITYLANYPGATVEVYNRGGQQVYFSEGYSRAWDGTRNGKPLPIGVYYYIIEPKNGLERITGTLTIVR